VRILGIDPGFGRCGWAILEIAGSKAEAIDYGCIETGLKLAPEKRLERVYAEISRIIKKYKPEVLAIEELFFGTNTKTALAVGQARGVVLLAASQYSLETSVYNPLQVKIALTGYGKAEKAQVGQMVKILLKLKEMPKLDDTTDALAVALTHASSSKINKLSR